jgi:hypothetical protein
MQIRIEWDAQPVRQSFGKCNVVADGVATLADGRRFRVNATANRACRKGEVMLRYLTEAKRGHEVPESMLADVRAVALESFVELLAPMRAAFVAEAQARDAEYMAERQPAPKPALLKSTRPANRHAVAIASGNVDKSNVIGLRKAINADARRSARLSVSPSSPKLQGAELAATLDLLAQREPLVRGELHASGVRLLTDKRYAKRLQPVAEIVATLDGFRLVRFDWLDDLHCFPVYRAIGRAGSFLFRSLPWQAVAYGRGDEIGGPVILPNDRPELVANTTRACYWRLPNGVYQASRPDERPADDATAGYPDLGALMRLKGEPAAFVASFTGGR